MKTLFLFLLLCLVVSSDYERSCLTRTELPSVSLLQKTPSSPVSCHATGFYPEGATMFWRKGGEELREGVDQGETLRNPDGTFQMSVDLKLSSVAPEDWGTYECVFQLSGVEKDIVTKLDKAVIRTNCCEAGIRRNNDSQASRLAPLKHAISLLMLAIFIFAIYVCFTADDSEEDEKYEKSEEDKEDAEPHQDGNDQKMLFKNGS